MFGGKPRRTEEGLLIETGSAPILFSSAGSISKRLKGVSLPTLAPPFVAALFIRVSNREGAAAALRKGGFTPRALKDGSFAIGANQANGIALVFG